MSGIFNYEAEGEALIVNNISNNGTLNADVTEISDYDGLGSFTFQWFRNELEVSGANLQQYLISEDDPYSAIEGAHAVAIFTEWDEFKYYDWKKIYNRLVKPAKVFDGRNILNIKSLKDMGFEVHSVGKASV